MMSDSSDIGEQKKSRLESLKLKITAAIGYLLPFVASLPPLAAWGGLMTVPFIIYLMMMFTNISTAPPPLPDLTRPGTIFIVTVAGLGLILLLYSVIYLWREKSKGLVVTGPYRICRHPQYFSLIIFTTIMTYQSVWILQNTFGIGWLTANETRLLWILMLVAYVVIAWIEEKHLEKQFGEEWSEYRKSVGFLLPFIPLKSYILEALVAIILPLAILEGLLYLPIIL
jgi:protein-S-isoprenylcysteine O-methyltransferase Ste14